MKAVFNAKAAVLFFEAMDMMKNIEWVWVDLDDTVWDFKTNSWDSLGELYYGEGLDAYFATVDEWREKYLECNHSLWPLYNEGKITKEFLQLERFRRVLDEAHFPQQQLLAMSQKLDPLYLSILGTKTRLIEGAREMLQYLKNKGYRLGLISNGFHEVQYRKMKSSNIEHFFDVVVLSDDVGMNKPHRAIFDFALEKAGTTAQQSVIIGDNPDTDIAGAIAAGWNAIYFNPNEDSEEIALPQNAKCINRLSQIEQLL